MSVPTPYADRHAAGQALAEQLTAYAGRDDVVVLGLPRGGVPVAAPVADALGAPLDVLVVRKLGLPAQPELAMGAIAGVGDEVVEVRNPPVLEQAGVGDRAYAAVRAAEVAELRRREAAYRGGRPPLDVRGRVVVLVDDGLATGSTLRAAVAALRRGGPARVVVAVPVGAADACVALEREVDALVCAWTPEPFVAVGQAYRDFRPTPQEQVQELLAERGR